MAELSEKWKRIVFAAGFVLLIVLAVDCWNWPASKPLIAGMPSWVIWDIAIVLMTGIYFLLFSIHIWRD